MELKLFTNLNSGVIYKSGDLILADKELIEEKIITEFKEINREIIIKTPSRDIYEVNSFSIIGI